MKSARKTPEFARRVAYDIISATETRTIATSLYTFYSTTRHAHNQQAVAMVTLH